MFEREEALNYHRLNGKPGKLSMIPSKPLESLHDLSLAFSPGVAEPVKEIMRDPDNVYHYTSKGNLVAVISNGTAIMGLGNQGALAAKPLLEGKAVLFKKFAGLDAFDIEIDEKDPDAFIKIVAGIAPTFGAINLEDIKSPDCFYIEQKLQQMLDIPVFHDDQHGIAIVFWAAFQNALEIVGKKPESVKVVFSGAGASAISCANFLIKVGVRREHLWMCDLHGLVYEGRKEDMFAEKAVHANGDRPAKLAEVIEDADVFVGLSVGDVLTSEMAMKMATSPIIFALANPDPEIGYDLAKKTRPDCIIATGRSDFPNQLNSLICFPFIFRGALDVRASTINDEMKIAVSNALAALAHEPISENVMKMYGVSNLAFGKDYLLPKAMDERLGQRIVPAVTEAARRTGVARINK